MGESESGNDSATSGGGQYDEEEEERLCAVCLEEFMEQEAEEKGPCGLHGFHRACLEMSRATCERNKWTITCPICRKE